MKVKTDLKTMIKDLKEAIDQMLEEDRLVYGTQLDDELERMVKTYKEKGNIPLTMETLDPGKH